MPDIFQQSLILASNSPRRKSLLSEMGFQFEVKKISVAEDYPSDLPIEQVPVFLSELKAKASAPLLKDRKNTILITADTIVCNEQQILEKAENPDQAKEMLQLLSGKSHEVISGICLSQEQRKHSFSVSTKVFMKSLSSEEIHHYIEHYQPYDKAGAYGIQEWIGLIGVEKIEGSFYNVMGLPTKELYEALQHFSKNRN